MKIKVETTNAALQLQAKDILPFIYTTFSTIEPSVNMLLFQPTALV